MFVTGPNVVKAVTNEDVDKETLGGAMTHNSVSGVSHFICDSDEETLRILNLYDRVIKGKLDGNRALEELDRNKEYTAIEDVRKTWLDKE